MSEPPSAAQAQPPSPRRASIATALILIAGILLLLPGLCSLFFVVGFAITEPGNVLKFSDPITGALWILWGLCFAVAIGGVILVFVARRRTRR
jgi:hypothetical protein